MRTGAIVSTLSHAAVIALALVSLPGAREPAEQFIDSMPVELVELADVTELKKGSKTAAPSEAPESSPVPSKLPEPKPVENPGEAAKPLDAPPTPEPAKVAAIPPPAATPEPQPEPTPEPEPEPAEASPPPPVEPPPPEPAATPPEPAPPEPAPAEPPPEEAEAPAPPEPEPPAEAAPPIPTRLPVAKPPPPKTPPKTQTAKAPDKPKSEDKSKFDSDRIAALLDKQKPAGGGNETPAGPTALGSERGTSTTKMTASELDLLRAQVGRCYNTPAGGAGDITTKAKVSVNLNPDGSVAGTPAILNTSSDPLFRAIAEAGRRAILRCQPYDLPDAKYETWREVIINFSIDGVAGG